MHVTLLLTRRDIVKNSYCHEGGAPIMQALQISDLNINPFIRPPYPPTRPLGLKKKKKRKKRNQWPSNGIGTPNIKLFSYYGEQLGYAENTSLIICSRGKLYIYFSNAEKERGSPQAKGRAPLAPRARRSRGACLSLNVHKGLGMDN